VTEPTQAPAHPADELLRVAEAVHAGEVSVAFIDGPTVRAKKGDKVVVDPDPTLEEPAEEPTAAVAVDRAGKTEVGRVVVIGAGVAGVTAAEVLRRELPDAELTLIGDEPYAFYNRMGITRLVSESVSIESLYLNRDDWAESRKIDYRRGLPVTAIDRENRDVVLADGERVPYDRVVIATGATPLVPPIDGFGAEGSLVLRTIDDAVQMQQHVRRHRCRTAVIVGAGLLGLEAAYYLTQLELRVVMLDRGPWPLSRQLDEQAGALLWEMLHDLGIELLPQVQAERIVADELVRGIELVDGGTIDAELCLVATGVLPNSELAEAAGLDVAGGVTVDDSMRTSDPHIYAVGDVVDHQGRRYGLWPASVEQAQVAATSMVGGEVAFSLLAQPARLKVPESTCFRSARSRRLATSRERSSSARTARAATGSSCSTRAGCCRAWPLT